jgi:hypothetical protein
VTEKGKEVATMVRAETGRWAETRRVVEEFFSNFESRF